METTEKIVQNSTEPQQRLFPYRNYIFHMTPQPLNVLNMM